MHVSGVAAIAVVIMASMHLYMSSSMFIALTGNPSGPGWLSASHLGVVTWVVSIARGLSVLGSGCSCFHSGMSCSVGVSAVSADRILCTGGGSSCMCHHGVTGRLRFVSALLGSLYGLHHLLWSSYGSCAALPGSSLAGLGSSSDCLLIAS